MNTETINSEKFELMNWIAQLQDLSLISELKKIKATSTSSESVNSFKQQLIDQANKANEAIKNGQIISSKELREKSNQW